MKLPDSFQKSLNWFYSLSWYSLVFLLVFTSLPLLASLIRTDTVAAPAVLPAFLLFAIWLVPQIFRGIELPFLTLPFLATVTVLVIATGLSFFLPVLPVKGRLPVNEVLDALVTLAVAVIVYLIAATFPNSPKTLRNTLRLVNLSGLVLVVWSLAQIFFIITLQGDYPGWMRTLQSWFSIRRLFHNRATGFAYEPSWLAHQLNMVFLPYWLAATLKGYSAHSRRIRWLTLENGLLLGGVVVLALSFSRVGWAAFGLAFSVALAHQTLRFASWLQEKLLAKRSPLPATQRALTGLVFAVFLGVYAFAGLGALEIAGSYDPRLDRFFERTDNSPTLYHFANRLAFAERAVAWGTGWEIFNDHPLMGVGLGNAGFYFNEEMPAFGWLLTEINEIYYRQAYLFNAKSLWTRLLAEGGIVSFVFFMAWVYLLWKSARTLQKSENSLLVVMGWTGVFFLLELSIEGFSIDSFALPYIWFTAGLVTAAAHLHLKTPAPEG